MTFLLYCVHSVRKAVFFQVVLWLYLYHFLFVRVNFLRFWFFLLTFRLAIDKDGLRIASERKGVKLIGIVFVELIWSG